MAAVYYTPTGHLVKVKEESNKNFTFNKKMEVKNMAKGIDVSKWQGTINWQKVKNAGVDFVIIREGYGKKSPVQIDKKFKENIEGAKNVGINTGVYHYSYADSVSDAKLEAEFCLENIQGYALEYPVVFDCEDKEMLKLTNRQRTDICKAFCEEIERNGYYAMIYCNLNWLENYLYKDELLPKWDLWLAQWDVNVPSYPSGIWQYSESGKIEGINGNVDLNISYKNYPEIIKSKGMNGFKLGTNGITETQNSSSKQEPFTSYIVNVGESLWSIAEKMLGSGSLYKEIKQFNNLSSDMIYPGQNLKIPKTNTQINYNTHTVKKGETLWGIAEKYYGDGSRYKEIQKINGLDNDKIYPGQVLKI